MGFMLYVLTMLIWCVSGSVMLLSGFDVVPTIIAAVCLAVNLAVVRFA
ncbi:hypothetical protein [Agrobacterium salinitolerans]|nr:hypothetical protein [Agrobacterium salinitolerans]NTA36831.1 hypothetical protein [Agrobacterium salinitolerans]